MKDTKNDIRDAIDRAIGIYIQQRKDKVEPFIKRHFSWKGAMKLNRKAFGTDVIKTPINIVWTIPYIGIKTFSGLTKKVGIKKISAVADHLPAGFETRIQKEVNWLIYSELLELPFEQDDRKSVKDALLEEIMLQPEVSERFEKELDAIRQLAKNEKYRHALEEKLLEYAKTRIAAADLAGSLISLASGATVFHKLTPGAFSAGSDLAAVIAQQVAISNFFLGSTLGGLYYGIFPASASMGLLIASTGTLVAVLAFLTSFSGIVSDPIQRYLGIHRRRLNKLIDSFERELRGSGQSSFKVRDQYVARVFDLLDLFRTAARTFS